jgi:hypothetical protein
MSGFYALEYIEGLVMCITVGIYDDPAFAAFP